jgi:hypothetical protein
VNLQRAGQLHRVLGGHRVKERVRSLLQGGHLCLQKLDDRSMGVRAGRSKLLDDFFRKLLARGDHRQEIVERHGAASCRAAHPVSSCGPASGRRWSAS